jgi:hypothetical protein
MQKGFQFTTRGPETSMQNIPNSIKQYNTGKVPKNRNTEHGEQERNSGRILVVLR